MNNAHVVDTRTAQSVTTLPAHPDDARMSASIDPPSEVHMPPGTRRTPPPRPVPAARSRQFIQAAWAILALAVAMRLPELTSRSFWTDEAYSFWFSSLSWHDLWQVMPQYETHPPFYYSALKLWMGLTGSSEGAMRALSVIASVATVAIATHAPRWIKPGPRAEYIGLIAGALLAINAGSLEYAQQARPYALQGLSCTAMLLLSCLYLQRLFAFQTAFDPAAPHDADTGGAFAASAPSTTVPLSTRRANTLLLWLGLGGCAGITLWLHNTSPVIIMANWLAMGVVIVFFGAGRRLPLLMAVIKPLLLALALWAPCIPILLEESRTVHSAFWAEVSPAMLSWPLTLSAGGRAATIPVLLLLVFGVVRLYQKGRTWATLTVYAIIALFLPMTLLFVVSYLFKPVFVTRTMAWMTTPVMVLVACGIGLMPGRAWRRHAILAVVVLLSLVGVRAYFLMPTEDLRKIEQTLVQQVRKDDLLLIYPNEVAVGINYYTHRFQDNLPAVQIPADYPALNMPRDYLSSNKGEPAVIPSDIPRIKAMMAGHETVWLARRTAVEKGHPDLVREALIAERGQPVKTWHFGSIDILRFDANKNDLAGIAK
ncbi:glycosyltransferase family 39 protein [Robbsia andropogonis]|uniref:glycosyltransferase family 39 protein n=1 Tax=Robbsia andropogonis TaxID=28092 RepID=UPI000560621D|nr:hypothetical protein [Robbsia andropogonis]MCP1117867.1 hypothetical protein [Robbsia andropogonis]MCP1127331.1 hypothetical protein [Robbsia andropogonis]